MYLNEAIENFIKDKKLQACTDKTIQGYSEILGRFQRFTGNIDMMSLSAEHIKSYNAMLIDKRLSKATVATYLRHIKVFLNWSIENTITDNDKLIKAIKLPKSPKKQITLFGGSDIHSIFEQIQDTPDWLRYRNMLIIALMYDSGLRQNEVCKIMHKDIDRNQGIMIVHGKGNKDRFVPIGKVVISLMDTYLNCCPYQNNYLLCDKIGNQITTNAIKKFIAKLRKRTGYKDLTSHKLRHNFATNFCIDGYMNEGFVDNIKLASLMGHESLETTQRYMHEAQSLIAASNSRSHLDSIF